VDHEIWSNREIDTVEVLPNKMNSTSHNLQDTAKGTMKPNPSWYMFSFPKFVHKSHLLFFVSKGGVYLKKYEASRGIRIRFDFDLAWDEPKTFRICAFDRTQAHVEATNLLHRLAEISKTFVFKEEKHVSRDLSLEGRIVQLELKNNQLSRQLEHFRIEQEQMRARIMEMDR